MKFNFSRVYTALNADELKIGSKVILADDLDSLKRSIASNDDAVFLEDIRSDCFASRFFGASLYHNLAYLVSEPAENKLQWTDLKVGDIITKTSTSQVAMVTQIDKEDARELHIYAGAFWLSDREIEEWEKLEVTR